CASRAASARTASKFGGATAGTTIASTPAATARARTSRRSASNSAASRWQCVSISIASRASGTVAPSAGDVDAARGGTGIRTRRDGLRDEAAVAQLQRAIGARRELQVVRDDDERDAELARQRLDQCIDL